MSEQEPINHLSAERYLHDTLYSLNALRELSMKSPELAIAGDQILEDCSVFKDLKTGDRITVSALPADEAEFTGAMVAITRMFDVDDKNPDQTPKQPQERLFTVTSRYDVFEKISDQEWMPFSPYDLAYLLDVPQTKPVAVSEYDPRDTPPILIGEIPTDLNPEELYTYFNRQLNADFLTMPEEALYTHCSGVLDALLSQDEAPGFGNVTLEGVIQTFKSQLFSLEINEMPTEESLDGYVGFDRIFNLTYTVLNGPTAMGAIKLGESTNVILVKGTEFDFKLTRGGMVMYANDNGRKVNLVPVDHTIYMLFLAAIVGE
ncbi:MAG: hypothetical protein NTX11_01225 [Candidatus Saccharibacteria bacterium]|nr:hypothetical protein [Candidatus Saccharibacteria bacterium]